MTTTKRYDRGEPVLDQRGPEPGLLLPYCGRPCDCWRLWIRRLPRAETTECRCGIGLSARASLDRIQRSPVMSRGRCDN